MEKGKIVDLVGKDLAGYTFGYCYALSIDQAGLLPAIVTETGTRVICLEEALIEKILKLLPERTHYIQKLFCLYGASGNIFRFQSSEVDDTKAESCLFNDDLDQLCAASKQPFSWPT
jgi:hypothetical protein